MRSEVAAFDTMLDLCLSTMSSSLRSRGSTKVPNDNAAESDPTVRPSTKTSDSNDEDGPTRLSVTDVLRILGGLLLLSSTLSYFITGESIFWNYRPAFTRPVRIKAWLVRPLLIESTAKLSQSL